VPQADAAEPARVKKPLTPLPVTDAVGLAYLHRHAAARAGVAVAENYNWLSSFHVPLDLRRTPVFQPNKRLGWRERRISATSLAHAQTSCCACCGTLGPTGCACRTDYRDQHLIFITTDRFVAAYDPETCDARGTGRSDWPWWTLIAFLSYWARRTLVAFWSHRPSGSGVSFFAWRSRLTLWSLRA